MTTAPGFWLTKELDFMQRLLKVLVLSATLAVVSAPTVARADGYISPFVGANFGNNSGNGRANVGIDAGWMGAGGIGIEADFGYAPNFFGNSGVFEANSVTDLMANVVLGVPARGQKGGVRPYVTIGLGLIRSKIDAAPGGVQHFFTDSEAGLDIGGGVMGYFSEHVGIRGDVRYFRDLKNNTVANDFNVDFGAFHFWRASFGIVLRP
jgi:hypothetical protein